ncbi:psbQ-like protein 3, chloroplastic [Sesamum indicum]|uniref:PsbQ-like protein 3, chloroplastic n=1 Tax=Sesamum indicum TaxID=4182 RepID=A0A6I9TUI2_SESIN|nr:psbQ-like protein 3, chloroplastic [Sesamum indicum]
MTVPDQTVEEAESGIEPHAQSLVGVKDLLVAESWKEAQKVLRKSSSLLKQDMYTIIQAKPAEKRGRLRKLYSDLFNGVMKLDYAARDEDRIRAWECYDRVISSLRHILATL